MLPYFALSNLIMVYLLGVVLVAYRSEAGPSIVASILSVAAFDFFFVPPYLTFAVSDTQYFVTFAVMLVVALLISGFTVRIRWLADAAGQRERRTAALYALSRELAGTRGVTRILEAATRHIAEVFRCRVQVLLRDDAGFLTPQGHPRGYELDATEMGVSRWVLEHNQPAGRGTGTLPGAKALYLPLVAAGGPIGVLGLWASDSHTLETPEQLHQMETFANQTALALERGLLAEEAHKAQMRMETERLRSSLLSSVSHDLRTPLSAITGAASALLETGPPLSPTDQRELVEAIREEADRLGRLVQNLLDMTRLESGAVPVRKEWHSLEEIVGIALGRLSHQLGARTVDVRIPEDMPLVPIDAVLIEQVFINLLDNALKYTPDGSPIDIGARVDDGKVQIEVADRGPGLAPGLEQKVFEKFYRGESPGRGSGLGLAICRGFVEVHGGGIWAENREGGGAAFRFTIPLAENPPAIEVTDG
jgi:two-component system sensor histidine kinase KdpD